MQVQSQGQIQPAFGGGHAGDVRQPLLVQCRGLEVAWQHGRGEWACRHWQTLVRAPVPAHVIDKGLPTSGQLSQLLVAKYAKAGRVGDFLGEFPCNRFMTP